MYDAEVRSYCQEVRRTVVDPDSNPEQSLYPALLTLLRILLPELAGQEDLDVIQQVHTELGAPDYKVGLPHRPPLGFVEAKAPENDLTHRRGHDREQFERYSDLPNWVYTNFWEFQLYRRGSCLGRARLVPIDALDPAVDLESALAGNDTTQAIDLLRRFVLIEPPALVEAKDIARRLAGAARLVRGAVTSALSVEPDAIAPLLDVREEFREVLFAHLEADEATYNTEFADAYAQTLAYGLLIARVESGQQLTLAIADRLIDPAHHPLLRATVRLLAEDEIVELVGWSLEVLLGVINAVDSSAFTPSGGPDPVLYFYEDFLAEYDPSLREARGVYYTPPAVVQYQVRAVHQLLKQQFGLPDGLLNERVHVLDPVVGTGTYLISCLREAAEEAGRQIGSAAVPDAARSMLSRLYGFELLVGPYAVAHYRLRAEAAALGAPPEGRVHIYLTDTLARSHESPGYTPRFAYLSAPLTAEREAADRVKSEHPILVVIGNPPYDRTTALQNEWVYRDLLDDFRQPVQEAGLGVHLKSLTDPYVYFYRWALWRLFEGEGALGEGVLSFITNRTWLLGEAFGGLRQMLRERFDQAWVFDLHGDSRAALPAGVEQDQNVFDIQTGVSIGLFVHSKESTGDGALVRYADLFGSRAEKEAALAAGHESQSWEELTGAGMDPFLPPMGEEYESWPSMQELFVFYKSGVKTERDRLVIDVGRDRLAQRIRSFLALPTERQPAEFHESGGRTAGGIRRRALVESLIRRITYRFLDLQYLYNDPDFVSRYGPKVQAVWGDNNIALYAMPSRTGYGPAAVVVGELPDYHAFRGSYGGYAFPLYDRRIPVSGDVSLDPSAQSNIRSEVVDGLSARYGFDVGPQDVFHYTYAVLVGERYSLRFARELQQSFPHVPFPAGAHLFQRGVKLGEGMVRLHTFQQPRLDDAPSRINGKPSVITAPRFDGGRLWVCDEAYVEPVSEEASEFSVSGYSVLRRWVERRVGLPLDLNLMRDLLEVIRILEETVNARAELADFLDTVLDGETLSATELGLRLPPPTLLDVNAVEE